VIKPPGRAPGREVAGAVSLLDVAPTLLGLAGLRPARRGLGRDLLREPPASDPILVANASTYPERYVGLRAPAWKYLRRTHPGDGAGAVAPRAAEELYDLRADPAETRNLAAEQPERLAALRAALERRLAAAPPPRARARTAPKVDAETARQLRALGYTE
jgi:arylsulfatase A-like enzyme